MKMTSIFFNKKRKFITNTEKKKTVDLPEDLVLEILSRVPEASLARFRSICKRWNTLIKNDKTLANKSFIIMLIDSRVYLANIDLHDNVVKVPSEFTLKDPFSDSPTRVDIREVFHCDGLLLCSTKDNRLVVWNPFLGKTSWIKTRDYSYKKQDIYALGKSSCNKYKILRMVPSAMDPCLVVYEVYDFTSNSWRHVGETRDWFIPGLWRCGVSVNGTTYWLAFSFSHDLPKKNFLLSFDFSTEKFRCLSLPGDHLNSYNVFALSVTRQEQKLCLLASRGYEVFDIDVWIATQIESSRGGDMSWRKFLKVESYHNQFLMLCNGISFLADRENKVIVCCGNHVYSNRFLHIVGEDRYIEVDHHEAGSKCSYLVSYVPTSVQIQQGSLRVDSKKEPST